MPFPGSAFPATVTISAELLPEVESLGLAASAVDTMMVDAGVSEAVARAALAVADRLR